MASNIHVFQHIVDCTWGDWDSENDITGPRVRVSFSRAWSKSHSLLFCLFWLPLFLFSLLWPPQPVIFASVQVLVRVWLNMFMSFLIALISPSSVFTFFAHLSSSPCSLHSVQDLVVRCMQQMVCAKATNIRSGWKNIFSVFTLAAANGDQAVVEMAFESTSELMIFIVSAWCEWGMIFLILYHRAQCCKCYACLVTCNKI